MTGDRANPLYSPLGCGSAVVLALVLGISIYLSGPVLFSPGSLSARGTDEIVIDGYGAHVDFQSACDLCHDSWSGVEPALCLECHATVSEERQLGTGMHGRLSGTERCLECHSDHNGEDGNLIIYSLTDFPHDSTTNFSLNRHQVNYSGQTLRCTECHPPPRYRADAVNCTDCHRDYDSQFLQDHISLFGADCLDCHDGLDAMSAFEHNSIFTLEGEHRDLACESCHDAGKTDKGIRQCVDCHEEPSVHLGQFGTDCQRCHNSSAWTPAQLSQHMFPLEHGDRGKIECRVCHQASYNEYTCYGCHEHQPQDMLEEHLEEDIEFSNDCAACHPTGSDEEA